MGDKLTKLDLARRINGRKGSATGAWGEASQPSRTRHGTATGDAENGRAPIRLDGSESSVSLACDIPVKSGDRVTVVSQGGTYKVIAIATVVNMVVEVGEESAAAAAAAENAAEVADAARDAADAAAATASHADGVAAQAQADADDALAQAGRAETAAGNAATQAGQAYTAATSALSAAQGAESHVQALDRSTAHSVATLFAATSDNLLADANEPTRYAVRGPADRYWSDSGNAGAVECSIVRVDDAPLADVDVASMFVADGSQTKAVSRRMAWYDGASVPLREGSSYVLSCWAYSDSPAGVSASLQVGTPGSSWKGQNSSQALAAGWRRYEWRFTYRAADHGSAPRAYVGASFAARTTAAAFVCGARLTCADEWDEVSTLIRQTAEGLLVASVGSAVGALVSAAGQFTVNPLTWGAGGSPVIGAPMASFNGQGSVFFDSTGKELAVFGASGAQVGRADGTQRNVYVGPDGVLLREGTTNLASFTGSGATVYAGGKRRLALTADGTVLYAKNGTTAEAVFGDAVTLGAAGSKQLKMDGSGIVMEDGGKRVMSVNASAWSLGVATGRHIEGTTSGVCLYDGSTMAALYGASAAQIGPPGQVHAVIANQSFDVVTGDATPKKLVSMTASGNNSRIESTQRPLLSGFFGSSGMQAYVNAGSQGVGLVAADVNAPLDRSLWVKATASAKDGLVYNGKKVGNIADYGRVDTSTGGTWRWVGLPDGSWLVQGYNPSLALDLTVQWGTTGLWSPSGLQAWTPPSQVPGTSWSSVSIGFVGGWGAVSSIAGRTVRWKALGSGKYRATGAVWLMGVMQP